MISLALTVGLLLSTACAHRHDPAAAHQDREPPVIVAIAPVLNLSNSSDWDPLQVTDIVASEFQSFPDVVVIPVNRTLAALASLGTDAVETPQDALDLAAALNADATVVTAITEYDPYYPPTIGVVMQWYAVSRRDLSPEFDPVAASRQVSEVAPAAATADTAPILQVQRVYNAAHDDVLKEVRSYAARRDGHGSPYSWRMYVKSQKLFIRYSSWASIRSILLERQQLRVKPSDDEAAQWKTDDDA
jgi:hypothetical protein